MTSEKWKKLNEIFQAALDLPKSERDDFIQTACDKDLELQSEVEKLLASAETDDGFLQEDAFAIGAKLLIDNEDWQGKQIGQYNLVRKIGRGGMGTVFLAERADAEFEQSVALKVIKRGMDTDEIVRRFRHERQILARLTHENIARLLDGGTTKEGLPYFVMEYVEGLPIDHYCSKNNLSTDEKLLLFRKVCSAIIYAHKHLVVHRDLKPSNILVAEDGMPKLLDFGIAKVLVEDDPNAVTQTGMNIFAFTPEYASPEQIRGEHLTTATDVYSLGIILRELLTENRDQAENAPKTKTAEDKTRKLKDETNEDLNSNKNDKKTSRKHLDGELNTIVSKAIHEEKERRYSSVEQFSDDIRRHLSGLPVIARPDTFSYRASKFIQRNRFAAITATIVLISVLGGLSAAIWQGMVAKQERAKAERRFNQVRKLAKTVLFDYNDNVAKLSGSTPLREKMVKDALEYLDNLSLESGNDKELLRELASAYDKVGDIQGNPFLSNLGDMDGALASYNKSRSIRENLYAQYLSGAQSRRDLAKSYQNIGDVLWGKGEYERALESYLKVTKIYSEMYANNQIVTADLYDVAFAEHNIGQTLFRNNRLDDALIHYNKELEIYEELKKLEPSSEKMLRGFAVAYLKIGDVWYDQINYQAALNNHLNAVDALQKLSSNEQDNAVKKREVALAMSRVALDYKKLNKLDDALNYNLKAMMLQKEISDADPTNVRYKADLAGTYGNLGALQASLKQTSAALENINKSIQLNTELLKTNPEWIGARRELGAGYLSLGDFLASQNNRREAIKALQKAVELLDVDALREAYKVELEDARKMLNKLTNNQA